ncbi:MAG: hypothetical protein GY737_16240 [Desulfobacteraceae bacterium]|nr:hypothetical protein [Desulfobacteraceae bacterium]
MNLETLMKFLCGMDIGTIIPGAQAGKEYKFGGVSEYSCRGKRYAHLKGKPVIALLSGERKRSRIVLFVSPLLLFVNGTDEELGFGQIPATYYHNYRSGDSPGIPNLYEFESHYKAFARHIKKAFPNSIMK